MFPENELYDNDWGFFVEIDQELKRVPAFRPISRAPNHLSCIGEEVTYYDKSTKQGYNIKKMHKDSDDLTENIEIKAGCNLKAKIKNITPYILVSIGSVVVVTVFYWKENNMI
jgi:hypothetical protein